ncbi:hypothetical protein FHG87_014935 [Trinorchestia longiramus]|nr:hypothetical protein FHG87_014935 [Trinorchestia longiramus]
MMLSLANERSRSGSSAQPTTLYNEATTLSVTHSPPRTSKLNISTKSSHRLNNSIHNKQQSRRKQKSAILSADRMGLKQLTH